MPKRASCSHLCNNPSTYAAAGRANCLLPVADIDQLLDPYARAILDDGLACAIVGTPDAVRSGLADFIRRTGADELMVTANIFDHGKRKRSFEIVAEVRDAMPVAK